MSQQQQPYDREAEWEEMMAHLVTEDGAPVDNRFSERQQRLLPSLLFSSWEEGKPFEAVSNVGLFYSLHGEPPVVPDFMLSLGVEPRPVTGAKADRSYMTWIYGKAPDLVVEVVSNREGEELGSKLEIYARVRVTYYVVYDPFAMLGDRELRAFRLAEGRYLEMVPPTALPEIGLGLILWEGTVEDTHAKWLRFTDGNGQMLLTADERRIEAEERAQKIRGEAVQARSEAEQARGEAEQARGEAEQARGEAEQARGEAKQARGEAEQARSEATDARTRAEVAEADALASQRRMQDLEQRLRDLEAGNQQS